MALLSVRYEDPYRSIAARNRHQSSPGLLYQVGTQHGERNRRWYWVMPACTPAAVIDALIVPELQILQYWWKNSESEFRRSVEVRSSGADQCRYLIYQTEWVAHLGLTPEHFGTSWVNPQVKLQYSFTVYQGQVSECTATTPSRSMCV